MAVFSTNQVRQLYVANAVKSPKVLATDAAGSISVNTDGTEGFYFMYKGADNLMRSDLINKDNVHYIKVTDAKDMQHELKSITVTLDEDINGGQPISGQDYILRIAFRQYIGMSDSDQYFKYGMVHAYATMSASDFYKKLAISLAKNFSRELTPLVKFTLKDGEGGKEVTATTTEKSLTGEYTALVITELPQEWTLGIKEQVPVYFEVQPTTITYEGDEVVWGVVEDTKPAPGLTIGNGHKIADLEYFCMGERGDVYRNIGWPNSIPTKLLVDPEKEYNVIDIHYSYVGSNESVQKSEKDITIVIPATLFVVDLINKLYDILGNREKVSFTPKAEKNAYLNPSEGGQ